MDNQAAPLARCLAAVDAHKLDDVRSCYAPDAAIVGPGVELHGGDQIIPWYQVFVTAFPDIRHEIRGTVQEGDACAVEVRVSGTHTGPLASPRARSRRPVAASRSTTSTSPTSRTGGSSVSPCTGTTSLSSPS
jgi:hypothetical protein